MKCLAFSLTTRWYFQKQLCIFVSDCWVLKCCGYLLRKISAVDLISFKPFQHFLYLLQNSLWFNLKMCLYSLVKIAGLGGKGTSTFFRVPTVSTPRQKKNSQLLLDHFLCQLRQNWVVHKHAEPFLFPYSLIYYGESRGSASLRGCSMDHQAD